MNRFGSFFYGSLLGVFMLAIGASRAHGRRRVLAVSSPAWPRSPIVASQTPLAFLWHNVVGVVVVVVVGLIVSAVTSPSARRA